MHELSIAISLVEIAAETAKNNGGGKVTAIYLRLGALAGVVRDALEFSWELATADTALAGSRLIIDEVPVIVRCPVCDADRRLDSINNFTCPVCGSPSAAFVQGKELELTALEIV